MFSLGLKPYVPFRVRSARVKPALRAAAKGRPCRPSRSLKHPPPPWGAAGGRRLHSGIKGLATGSQYEMKKASALISAREGTPS